MSITIRRVEPGDAAALQKIFDCPQVQWGTLQLPYPSVEMWQQRLANPPEGLYSLVACAGEEVVGQIGLHTAPQRPRRRHAAQLGMAVRDDWQGKGVGSALLAAVVELADRWLNLTRLELDVYTDNERAIHLYRKFGFVVEGTALNYAWRDGRYIDTYLMARLRPPLD